MAACAHRFDTRARYTVEARASSVWRATSGGAACAKLHSLTLRMGYIDALLPAVTTEGLLALLAGPEECRPAEGTFYEFKADFVPGHISSAAMTVLPLPVGSTRMPAPHLRRPAHRGGRERLLRVPAVGARLDQAHPRHLRTVAPGALDHHGEHRLQPKW